MSFKRLLLVVCMLVACSSGGDKTTDEMPELSPTPKPAYVPLVSEAFPPSRPNFGRYGLEEMTALSPMPYLTSLECLSKTRCFASTWPGQVLAWNTQTGEVTLVLDIQDRVANVFNGNGSGEEGLFSIALDPSFEMNGHMFVSYARTSSHGLKVSRFSFDDLTGSFDVGSEEIVLEIPVDQDIHKGGHLNFAPDGNLFVSVGDGGPWGQDPNNVAQDLTSLRGKILRINVTSLPYTVPAGNPFEGLGTVRGEIFALGFRNPWRIWIDPNSEELWVSDVGENSYEEVNLVAAGGNYGWPHFEGTEPLKPGSLSWGVHQRPLYQYNRRGVSGSITGGFIYRGDQFPDLKGYYVFGDYAQSKLWALEMGEENQPSSLLELANPLGPVSIHEELGGEIMILSLNFDKVLQLKQIPDESGAVPLALSETGFFKNLEDLKLEESFIPYEVQSPLWSDGVNKMRWFAVPELRSIKYDPSNPWELPVGSVLVKHFEANSPEGVSQRIETRILFKHDQGFQGYGYEWNEEQTDAYLVTSTFKKKFDIVVDNKPVRVNWTYPAPGDCKRCHTDAAKHVLGLKSRQTSGLSSRFNGMEGYSQIQALSTLELFSNPEDINLGGIDELSNIDSGNSVELRARSYLDSNCSHCHQPGGPTPSFMDLRFGSDASSFLDFAPFVSDQGVSGAKLVKAGEKEKSLLWLRLAGQAGGRMPPLGVSHIDHDAVDLIGYWIDQMTSPQ